MKTLVNYSAEDVARNTPDVEFFGNGDQFQLLCKASSQAERWLKSTKAMEIPEVGCVVQVTTYDRGQIAEAVCFVPNVKIVESVDDDGKTTGRKLKGI